MALEDDGRSLVLAYQAGDDRAFSLYEKHIRSYVAARVRKYRYGKEDSEDAYAEAIKQIMIGMRKFNPSKVPGSPFGFLKSYLKKGLEDFARRKDLVQLPPLVYLERRKEYRKTGVPNWHVYSEIGYEAEREVEDPSDEIVQMIERHMGLDYVKIFYALSEGKGAWYLWKKDKTQKFSDIEQKISRLKNFLLKTV